MIYFFYGVDSFRIRQKVNEVVAKYRAKHKSGLNFSRFDLAQEEKLVGLKEFLESCSMFAEKKLAVVENLLNSSAEQQQEFSDLIDRFGILSDQERFVAIVQQLELSGNKKRPEKYIFKNGVAKNLFRKLTVRPFQSEEFNWLPAARLVNWIQKEVGLTGGGIEKTAAARLAAFVGPDLWQMHQEIKKLVSFRKGGMIESGDVELLVRSRIENDIFRTIDALGQRQRAAVFQLLHQHLAEGESEIYLLTMFLYQFRHLLLVREQLERGVPFYNLSNKSHLPSFVMRKIYEQARGFSLGALKKIYERLAEMDIQIKTGQIEPRVALDLIVQEITA